MHRMIRTDETMNFLDRWAHGRHGRAGQPHSDAIGIRRLHPDQPCRGRENTQTACQHHCSSRGCIVHVGEFIPAFIDRQKHHVGHVGNLSDDRSGRTAEIDRIDHDKQFDPAHEFLN